jgi:hypothetical protein
MLDAMNTLAYIPGEPGEPLGQIERSKGTRLREAILRGCNNGDSEPNGQGLFSCDMRIHSWHQRYARADPVIMLGDPPLSGLNTVQRQAIAMMLREPLSLVQGPPGTGKTRTIVEAVKLLKVGH